jgi:hypothetical protein
MADNDLAQAYSILGQGLSSTYRNRRKEEEDYRDDARRAARKEQLISYVAAPILQGAGKALASGATDLVGNLVLGENGKDFFNTETGRIAARRSRYADDQEKKLLTTRSQLMQGGRSELEGQIKFLTEGFDAELEREYGSSPENAFTVDQARRDARPGLEKEAERLVKERQELITYAAQSPDIDVLKARVKQEDSYYGKTKGKRIMSTLVGKLFGKNPAEQGASYILTGSNDPTEAQRILRDNLMSDTYVEDFSKKLAAIDSSKKNAYENAFTEFALENPNLVRAMKESQRQGIEKNLEKVQYVSDLNRDTQVYLSTDPARAEWYQTNGDKYNNVLSLKSAYFNSIKGFGNDEAEERVDLFVASQVNAVPVDKLVKAVAFKMTNLTGEVVNDSEKFKEQKEYAAIQKSSKEFISNVLVPRFNEDLSLALVNMSGAEKEALLAGEGSREELLRQYITYQIDNNLATESKLFAKGVFTNEMSEENVALLKDPKAGLKFIMGQDPDDLAASAQGNGSKSTPRLVGDRKPQYFKMNEDKVEGAFKFIAGSNQSKAKLRKRADNQLTRLLVLTNTEVRTRGWIGDDGETLFSPQTMEDHALLKKRVYDMIDAKFVEAPAASTSRFATVPVTAEDADKAATLARSEQSQQRRAATADKFSRAGEVLKDILTRGGDISGFRKGKQFGSPREQASSLLNSPTDPNPGFRSSKRSYLK